MKNTLKIFFWFETGLPEWIFQIWSIANEDGVTPLHFAALYGHFIADNIVNKCPADHQGFTPLHDAASKGHLEIYRLLMIGLVDKNPGHLFILQLKIRICQFVG